MKKWFQIVSLLVTAVFLLTPRLFAQDNEPTLPPVSDGEQTAPAEQDVPASQEVEINEDNYRQFMELKDAKQQRDIIPENAFKPSSGLQKLEKLPEESQKHLRNQLREIIVQGDPWQPGDEENEFPYTPSLAAGTNPSLEKQEKEAWGELVDSYNQREAQIYENSSGSQAARGAEQGSSNSPGNGAGSTGSAGQNGEGSQGQQAGEEGNPDQSSSEGTYSLDGSNDPNADSTAGVSQNAMQFLQGLGEGGSGTADGKSPPPEGDGGQSGSPTTFGGQGEAQAQAQTGQQASVEQNSGNTSGTPNTASDPNAKNTAGTSQNALEFLKGNAGQNESADESGNSPSSANESQGQNPQELSTGAQADSQEASDNEGQASAQEKGKEDEQAVEQGNGQAEGEDSGQTGSQDDGQAQDGDQSETAQKPASSDPLDAPSSASPVQAGEESTVGASQNALEYLTGERAQSGDGTDNDPSTKPPEGTLTIQDLLNAQGVSSATGTTPESPFPDEETSPDKQKPDKDGGG